LLLLKPGSQEFVAFAEGLEAFGCKLDVVFPAADTRLLHAKAESALLQLVNERNHNVLINLFSDIVRAVASIGCLSPFMAYLAFQCLRLKTLCRIITNAAYRVKRAYMALRPGPLRRRASKKLDKLDGMDAAVFAITQWGLIELGNCSLAVWLRMVGAGKVCTLAFLA
jgi:hypothetical protein